MFDYDAYFNTPEQIAKQKANLDAYYADRKAEDNRINDQWKARAAIVKAASDELKADNDAAELKEYNKLFAADKARYIAAGYTKELSHTLACSDAQYRENQKLGYSNEQEIDMKIIINDKEVDPGSIVIAGIDPRDYPDFADAYVEYAETVNGYGLTEAECELLQDYYSDVVYEQIIDQACCSIDFQEIKMDNVTIFVLGLAVFIVILLVGEALAKFFDWEE